MIADSSIVLVRDDVESILLEADDAVCGDCGDSSTEEPGSIPDGLPLSGKKYVISGSDDVDGLLKFECRFTGLVTDGTESLRSLPI